MRWDGGIESIPERTDRGIERRPAEAGGYVRLLALDDRRTSRPLPEEVFEFVADDTPSPIALDGTRLRERWQGLVSEIARR